MEITKEQFTKAVGHEPENDDLDRCNCPDEGKPGHYDCGWDAGNNKPRFMLPYRQQTQRKA